MKFAIVDDTGALSDALSSAMSDPDALTRTGVFATLSVPNVVWSKLTQSRLGCDSETAKQPHFKPNRAAELQPENSPAEHARLLDAMGRIYLDNGRLPEAKFFIVQALEARQKLYGTEHPAIADSLNSLARILRDEGDLNIALQRAQEALKLHSRINGGDSLEAAMDLAVLGSIQYQRNELTAAEQSVLGALNIYQARLRSDDPIAVPYLLDLLARIQAAHGNFAKALELYKRALDIDERTHGKDHPAYAARLHNIATVQVTMRNFSDAERNFKTAIGIFESTGGERYPCLIDAYSNRGALRLTMNDKDGARADFDQALKLNRDVRGPKHLLVGHTLVCLGLIDLDGDTQAALKYFEDALEILTATLPPNHAFIASARTNQGIALVERNEAVKAQSILENAIDMWRIEYGEHSSHYAIALATLGRSLLMQGQRAEDAEKFLRNGLAIIVATQGESDWYAGLIKRWLQDLAARKPAQKAV